MRVSIYDWSGRKWEGWWKVAPEGRTLDDVVDVTQLEVGLAGWNVVRITRSSGEQLVMEGAVLSPGGPGDYTLTGFVQRTSEDGYDKQRWTVYAGALPADPELLRERAQTRRALESLPIASR